MESSIKTNRLAIFSFASGLIAILSIGLVFIRLLRYEIMRPYTRTQVI